MLEEKLGVTEPNSFLKQYAPKMKFFQFAERLGINISEFAL